MMGIKSRWRCDECGELHDYEEDALECCGYDPEAPPPPPTTYELEALGQMRLFP